MKATDIFKPMKRPAIWWSLLTLLGLGLVHNAIAGGDIMALDPPDVHIQDVTPVKKIIVMPIHLLPDFYIQDVTRVRDDSNPYQTFYRYTVTISNRGGYCSGGQGAMLVRGTFVHVDNQGQYTSHNYAHVVPPANWGDEVTLTLWDGVSDTDNADWWHTIIRIDVDEQYIESDEGNNVWQCNNNDCGND